MAIPNGKPATDFSAMNREYIRAVAKEEAAAGGNGIPAPENPSNGDVLTYNSTSEEWEAANPPAPGIPAPANPSNGDVLTYNSTNSAWEAAAPSAGGSDVVFVTYYFDDTTSDFIRCSMTPAEINTALNSQNAVIAKTVYVNQNDNSENFTYEVYLPNGDMTYVSDAEFYFNFDSIQPRIERTPDGVRLSVVNLHHDENGVTLNGMQLFIDATT